MWRTDRYSRYRTPHPRAARHRGEYGSRLHTPRRAAIGHDGTGPHPRGYGYASPEYTGSARRHGYSSPKHSYYTSGYGYSSPEYRHSSRRFTHPLYDYDYDRQHFYPRSYRDGHRLGSGAETYRSLRPQRDADTLWAAPANRRRREPRRPWTGDWNPDEWWHAIGPEPRADYDWAYESRRPERYGWTGETGRG